MNKYSLFCSSLLIAALFFVSCAHAQKGKIAIVVSNMVSFVGPNGQTHGAGVWAEELVVPQRLFENAGFEVVLVSPTGGSFIFDKMSYNPDFIADKELISEILAYMTHKAEQMKKTIPLSKVSPQDFSALFVAGGHGVMFDVAKNKTVHKLAKDFLEEGKVLSAICHGPCFLAQARFNGKSIVAGYKVTGFSNAEEIAAQMNELMPFSLEDGLQSASSGLYRCGEPWKSFVVVDRLLITGQNPASSEETALAVISALSGK